MQFLPLILTILLIGSTMIAGLLEAGLQTPVCDPSPANGLTCVGVQVMPDTTTQLIMLGQSIDISELTPNIEATITCIRPQHDCWTLRPEQILAIRITTSILWLLLGGATMALTRYVVDMRSSGFKKMVE